MPNYFVTNTARFNPFTLQELSNYASQASQMEYATEEALNSLDDGTLEYYLSGEDKNSPLVQKYNEINQRIQSASEQLGNKSVPLSAIIHDVSKIKGDYKKYMTPVETMGKKKQQLMDEYRKLSASNPYLIGEDPGQYSLQWYIDNPNFNPTYDNGEAYIKQGTLIGSQLADQLRNPDAPYTIAPGSGGQLLRAVFRRGYTQEELASDPMFVNVTNQILESRGLDPNGTDARTNAARAYIQQGLYSALGKDDVQERANQAYMNPLQALQYQKTKAEIDALKNPPINEWSSVYDMSPYADPRGVSALNKLISFVGDFDEDSLNITTKDGQKLTNRLDVYNYLKGLDDSKIISTPTGPRVYKSSGVYNKEHERLKNYTLSDKEYRDLRKSFGYKLGEEITSDNLMERIMSNEKMFKSGNLAKFSLANDTQTKDQLDSYMSLIKTRVSNIVENDPKLKNGEIYKTDGVNFTDDYDISKFKDLLNDKDTKVTRISTTTPLLNYHTVSGNPNSNKPYIYLSTNRGEFAVPASYLGIAGEALLSAGKMISTMSNADSSSLLIDNDNFYRMMNITDAAIRASNKYQTEQVGFWPSASKGRL